MSGWLGRVLACAWVAVSALGGCADDAKAAGGEADAVRPRFELVPGAQPFGSLPFPDDLYLDESGRVRIGEFPASLDEGYGEVLRSALAELDGFGAVSPVFFFFDGPLDPRSLPATPEASLADDATVLLIDVDPGSPQIFTRIPIRVRFRSEGHELALRPADGRALVEGRKYAAIVRRNLRDREGRSIEPSPIFAAIRDATQRPADPMASRAFDQYQPVLGSLERAGLPRDEVAALSVFRVQSIASELRDARDRLLETARPVARLKEAIPAGELLDARLGQPTEALLGIDVPGGVLHDAIAWMIEGELDAPSFLDARDTTPSPFARDASNRPQVSGETTIPFTLLLPKGVDVQALRLIVFGHDLGRERSDVFAFADALAGAGWAVLAFDAPFHGLRHPSSIDDRNRLTKTTGEGDGFGDFVDTEAIVELLLADAQPGTVVGAQPVYLRDFTRQTVLDLVSMLRMVREGDLDAIRGASEALAGLAFSSDPIGYVGVGLGGTIGGSLATLDPSIGPMLLVAPTGYLTQSLVASPVLSDFYAQYIFDLLGISRERIQDPDDPPEYYPELALFQTLCDRGDALSYAPYLRRTTTDVLLTMAQDDEQVTNAGTEALARAIGASIAGGTSRYAELEEATLPLRSNFETQSELVTRGLVVYTPATHSLLLRRVDMQQYAHPLRLPFERIEPRAVDNPIDRAIAQMVYFFETSRSGRAEIADPPAR